MSAVIAAGNILPNGANKAGSFSISGYRITSIDILRGAVMIIMALDHVREFFHADAFIYSPTDLSKTNVALFLTRWVTYFCAPVFMFLAGTSAFLIGMRKSKKELTVFLFTRGLWLMLLELTIVNFAWSFNIHFPYFCLLTIWALGVSMIVLSVFIHLPFKAILAVAVLIVAGHNALDNFHFGGTGLKALVWSAFIEPRWSDAPDHFTFFHRVIELGYPLLPWIGIMLLGYCFGKLYSNKFDAVTRKQWLISIGVSAILTFIILRLINIYGDPQAWSVQKNITFTILSFINVTKFPPSLLFTLITLGPAISFLALIEKTPLKGTTRIVSIYGRVPMFYYLLHLYLIHTIALFAAEITGHPWQGMIANAPWTFNIGNYGFSLPVVYCIWIAVVIILYPLCKWYDGYKTGHKEKWWLSYL